MTLETYRELQKITEKVKVWPEGRSGGAWVLGELEDRPISGA